MVKARELRERVLEVRRRVLGQEHPDTLRTMDNLAGDLFKLRELEESRALYERVLEARRRVRGQDHPDTLRSLSNVAVSRWALGEHPLAAEAILEGLHLVRSRDETQQLRVSFESNANNMAWTFVKDPELLNIDAALITRLAEGAVDFEDPTYGPSTYWNTLGAVYYRTGDLDSAVDALNQSIELRDGGDAYDWFFLAMALHRRGDTQPARDWYDRAVAWTEANRPDDAELLGIWAEAATVLGLPESVRTHLEDRATAASLGAEARTLLGAQRWDEAEATYRRIVDLFEDTPARPGSVIAAELGLAMILRNQGRPGEADPLLEDVIEHSEDTHQLELAELIRRNRFGPGRSESPSGDPTVPLVLDAPLKPEPPVADGRIEDGEYGPAIAVDFTSLENPGRLMQMVQDDPEIWAGATKQPEDLSFSLASAHTNEALYLAFEVRDQFLDDQDEDASAPYKNDGIDLYINGDLMANDQSWMMGLQGNPEGFQLLCDVAGHQSSNGGDITNDDWTAATGRTEDGYVIELVIPLELIDTKDGPGEVPPSTGSFLLMNAALTDNDEHVSASPVYATLWNEGRRRPVSFFMLGEDFWNVGLRLTPGETPDEEQGGAPVTP